LVNFLLLLGKSPQYNKEIINKGLTPQIVYKLCSCIRETFCLSYSIRKENNLFLYFQKEHILISFIGTELRYLGPDERSQALLLEKALNKANKTNLSVNEVRKQSTPGIYFNKFWDDKSFKNYLNSHFSEEFALIIKNHSSLPTIKDFEDIKLITEFFYIIPIDLITKNKLNLIQMIIESDKITLIKIPKANSSNDKILYINFKADKFHCL